MPQPSPQRPSTPSQPARLADGQLRAVHPDRRLLRAWFIESRRQTLDLLAEVSDADFRRQAHPDFSPVGWHLGHIGVTEGYWILQRCEGRACLSDAYEQFFSPTENPKTNRINLPDRAAILAYLDTVREQMLVVLDRTDFSESHPLLQQARIFRMLLQHEAQHQETMTLVLQLLATDRVGASPCPMENEPSDLPVQDQLLRVPAGPFPMGSNSLVETLDNERTRHEVEVGEFWIDRYPVTNAQFARFVQGGGYRRRAWWSPEGWAWREKNAVEHPCYWRQQPGGWTLVGLTRTRPLAPDHPVMGVSWYEAEAYARAANKRLPTEAEWEKAASWDPAHGRKRAYPWGEARPGPQRCNSDARHDGTSPVQHHPAGASAYGCMDMQGNVWEWTATWFQPYPDFCAYPYDGYSTPYFDHHHRVLRGGSWATRSHVLRPTFRNWYHPWVREIFAGFRCAR
ncbi:MAG: ergothioneine biosynthesis protein EgtB [Desulfurellaceae bacterium]|nr:ergothioneine biosynthesis protein EgtB [Desulfurellaceae bacterium]